MSYIFIGTFISLLGLGFGVWSYHELWKWARKCQNVRIAIAYKNKVKMEYPLTEWILWTNLLDKDEHANGRVVYSMGATRVAIVKQYKGEWTWRRAIAAKIHAHIHTSTVNASPSPRLREGKWTSKDETKASP